jgi:hypothetical protein
MKLKRLAGLLAGAVLATGLVATAAAPASAENPSSSTQVAMLDTGWGP